MKISISGLPGCGKSSISNELNKILSLKQNIELVEISKKNPFDSGQKSCFVSQFFYMSTQINQENVKSDTSPDILLCDQSVLDHWVYWKKYRTELSGGKQIKEKDQIINHLYRFWIKTYDMIIYIRTDLEKLFDRYEGKGPEDPGQDYFIQMDRLYNETISEDKLKIQEIWNNQSIDECVHYALEAVSKYQESSD